MRALFFLTLSTICHSAIYAWLMRSYPALRERRRRLVVLAIFAVIVVSVPVGRIIVYRINSEAARVVTAFAMGELLVALMALVPMLGVRLAGALIPKSSPSTSPTASGGSVAAPSAPVERPTFTRREMFERAGGLVVLGSSGASIGWGVVRGRLDFQIEEVVVKIPGLPRALEGYTITQVSDLHVGLFVDERELRKGLSLVTKTKPDLIVATGDLVDFDTRYVGLMARSLGDLRSATGARDGVAAILGNHDYYTDGDDVREGLLRAGVRALVNEHVVLRPNDGGGIVLAGVDDFAGARYGGEGPDLARALANAPAVPRILLAHQPHYFAESRGKVALQLSGHVHGGQINPIIHPARYVLQYVAGRYEGEGSTMWVNRGFGTAGPPARLGSPPEITRVVLVSG